MPVGKLTKCRFDFEARIDELTSLQEKTLSYCDSNNLQTGTHALSKQDHELIVELCMIEVQKSWEVFLETCFTLYLAGEKTDTGYEAGRHIHFPVTSGRLERVGNLLKRSDDKTKWEDDKEVSRRAKIYFKNGGKFVTTIKTMNSEVVAWREAVKLRNAAAHKSGNARQEYKNLIISKLGSYPVRRISVGKFLLETDRQNPSANQTYWEHYCGAFRKLAKRFVP